MSTKTLCTTGALALLAGALATATGCGAPMDGGTAPRDVEVVHGASDLSSLLDKYIPPGVKAIAQDAVTVSDIYTKTSSALSVAKAVLTVLGFLEQAQSTEPTLTQISGQITQATDSIAWLVATQDRENRLADAAADFNTIQQSMQLPPFTINQAAVSHSAEVTKEAESSTAFLRAADESVTDGDGMWKSIIATRQPQVMDASGQHAFVYDWRLGVPALMELVRQRLNVIGLIDPNFRQDYVFCNELTDYSTAIWLQGIRMESDVVCGTRDFGPYVSDGYELGHEFQIACADINSGAALEETIERPPGTGVSNGPTYQGNSINEVCGPNWDECTVCYDWGCQLDYQCYAGELGECAKWWDQFVTPIEDALSSKIRAKMPTYEMNVFRNELFSLACPTGD